VARLVKVGEPLELGTVQKPQPGPTDVLVKVEACSLVPNSKNLVTNKARLPLPNLPCIFGLDAAGTIESVGEHVLNLKVGDRVYVDPFLTCRSCHFCRKGKWCYRSESM
jgi:alcohol dehydrogenase